jgi:hypothetical protein
MDEIPNISGFNYRIARHKVGDDAYYHTTNAFTTRTVGLSFGVNHHRMVKLPML